MIFSKNTRDDIKDKIFQAYMILGIDPRNTCLESKTQSQLLQHFNTVKKQLRAERDIWPELYARTVFRMALFREPSNDELRTWVFGLVITHLESRIMSYFELD